MTRKNTIPLSEADLTQFIQTESDFAFEMATLAELRAVGMRSEHAGAYVDPVTGRIRAYDIRARNIWNSRSVRLAVECKNLRGTSPLLVHATPRLATESYHTVLRRNAIAGVRFESDVTSHGVYQPDEPVGRQTDQPTRDDSGNFKSSDAPTYEKLLQAVNGCHDLIRELVEAPLSQDDEGGVVPLLVVPAHTLWQVDYGESGAITQPVRQVERTTLILRHRWSVESVRSIVTYDISHLEIVTLPALRQRVNSLLATLV